MFCSGKCDTCPVRDQCQGSKIDPSKPNPTSDKILAHMKAVHHKVLILSCKGGVGKSTLTSQLAFALSSYSKNGTPLNIGVLDIY